MRETYTIYTEAHGTRVPAAVGIVGREVLQYVARFRKAGLLPFVYKRTGRREDLRLGRDSGPG